MKIKLFFSLFVFLLMLSTSYASFPVKRTVKSTENTEVTADKNDASETYTAATTSTSTYPDKWVGVALWFFLGWPFAAHRWYYKKPVGWNILFILTIGGLGIWAIIDLINILTDNF